MVYKIELEIAKKNINKLAYHNKKIFENDIT